MTANAYLGSRPIADALAQDADLVITGRVADPSLTVGPCRIGSAGSGTIGTGWPARQWQAI